MTKELGADIWTWGLIVKAWYVMVMTWIMIPVWEKSMSNG